MITIATTRTVRWKSKRSAIAPASQSEYVAKKFKVNGSGSYSYDGFLIVTCADGSGAIANEPIAKGETILIPCNYGTFELKGSMELIAISYNEKNGDKA